MVTDLGAFDTAENNYRTVASHAATELESANRDSMQKTLHVAGFGELIMTFQRRGGKTAIEKLNDAEYIFSGRSNFSVLETNLHISDELFVGGDERGTPSERLKSIAAELYEIVRKL